MFGFLKGQKQIAGLNFKQMEITGTIVQVLAEVSGTSKAGNTWRKQEYLLETKDQYPKKILFNLWGEKIDQFALLVGEEVTVGIDLESREYNGRWYTEVKAWNVRKGAGAPVSSSSQSEPPAFHGPPPMPVAEDSLPF